MSTKKNNIVSKGSIKSIEYHQCIGLLTELRSSYSQFQVETNGSSYISITPLRESGFSIAVGCYSYGMSVTLGNYVRFDFYSSEGRDLMDTVTNSLNGNIRLKINNTNGKYYCSVEYKNVSTQKWSVGQTVPIQRLSDANLVEKEGSYILIHTD